MRMEEGIGLAVAVAADQRSSSSSQRSTRYCCKSLSLHGKAVMVKLVY